MREDEECREAARECRSLKAFAACAALLAVFMPAAAWAVDPNLHWYSLEGPHFLVIYHEGEEALAAHMLDEAEATAVRLDPWLGWTPDDKVQLVVTDHVDLPNGLTTPIPRNNVQLYVAPPDGLDTLEDFDDWFRLLITHEYTHVLQLDKATGAPGFMRHIFGRNPLLMPGIFQPRVLTEGLAVYDETDTSLGVGRGQGSLYAMYNRAEAARGVRPWSQVTMAGVTEWPAGTIPYLYGIDFQQYIAGRYGRDTLRTLVDNYNDNLWPFLVQTNISHVLDEPMDGVWSDFSSYLQQRYGTPPYPPGTALVEGERLTQDGYGTSSPVVAADGRVFYVRDDDHEYPALMVWEAGTGSRKLADTFMPARLDWNEHVGLLVARPEVCEEYHLNFDLYRVDADDGGTTRLTHCGRYHYGAWSPDGGRIVAARIALGQSSLVLLDADGDERETLWRGTSGEILGALDWSPDGAHIAAAVWRPGRRWGIEEFDVATRTWRPLVTGMGAVGDPRYAPDGASLFFTSDTGGVYNLRRLDRATGALTTLTHVSTGAFSPAPGSSGDIYYIGYTAEGYDLYRLPATSALAEPLAPDNRHYADAPPAPAVQAQSSDYSPWASLVPAYWSPELAGAPDFVQLGAATSGADALGVHQYAADINFEFTHHLAGGSFQYLYADRVQFLAARTYVLYNSTDALERIRRSDKLELLWQRPWPSLERTLTFSAGGAGDSERDVFDAPGFFSAPARDEAAGFAFNWNSSHEWPVSISPDDGRDVTLLAETSNGLASDYRGNAYRLDWQEYWRVGEEAVLTGRYLEGYGTQGIRPFNLGGPKDPGYGTPAAEFLFDRRDFAFPGYPTGLAGLEGLRMRFGSLGLRLPLARPESGWWAIGAHDFSLRLYYDMGGTWDQGGRPAQYSRSAGAEGVADLSVLYLFDLRLILGVAHGYDAGGENQAYVYLEIPLL